MELEKTSLYKEIENVINSGDKPVHYSWKAEVIANGEVIAVTHVISIDIIQDYELNYGDELLLTALIPAGTYSKRIVPFQDHLDVVLYKYPLKPADDNNDISSVLQTEKYTAYLIDATATSIEGNAPHLIDEQSMNLTNLNVVNIQLVNKALEKLRLITVGGPYRNCIPGDVVSAILTTESQKLGVEKGRTPIGVTMVKPDNQQKRDHVILPHGLPLVDLPMYVHHRCGGIYNAGLSYYFQDNFWYVYPCYNVARFREETRTLTVVNVPPNKFPQVERTYLETGNNLTILATGEVKYRDNTDDMQMSLGNGTRFADGNSFMGDFVKVSGNKAVSSRNTNANEFTGEARKNGINHAPLSEVSISANPYLEYSKLAMRQGGTLNFVWENSNPKLVYPGMMIKILYLEDGLVKEIYGTALKMHHFIQSKGTGILAKRHVTFTSIVVFVQPPKVKENV